MISKTTQLENLFLHMQHGASINHSQAHALYAIQNLTARLSELKELGWKTAVEKKVEIHNGVAMKISEWKLVKPLVPGDYVRIRSDLMERYGTISRIKLCVPGQKHSSIEVVCNGVPYSLPPHRVEICEHIAPGTIVSILPTVFTVEKFSGGHYVLSTADKLWNLAVPGSVLKVHPEEKSHGTVHTPHI